MAYRLSARQIRRMAKDLVADMVSGEVFSDHMMECTGFSTEDERLDHERYVMFLGSNDFDILIGELHDAARMDGVDDTWI